MTDSTAVLLDEIARLGAETLRLKTALQDARSQSEMWKQRWLMAKSGHDEFVSRLEEMLNKFEGP